MLLAVAVATAAIAIATPMQPEAARMLSPLRRALSPYRRPAFLQPRRYLADAYVLQGELAMSLSGRPPAVMGKDVEVRDAGRRGLGLFAMRDFEEGEIVTRYSGIFATEDEYQEAFYAGLTEGRYIAKVDLAGSVVMDAERASETPSGHGGRYVNHSRLWANTRITSFTVDSPWKPGEEVPTGAVYIMTTKAVKAGSEFLTDYGDGYWSDTLSTGFSLQPEELLKRAMIHYLP